MYLKLGNFFFTSIKRYCLSCKLLVVFYPLWFILLGCSAEENMIQSSLFNVTWEEGTPSIDQIQQKYGFEPGEIDTKYGVIEIDPEDSLYTIKVDSQAAERVYKNSGRKFSAQEGSFSNPRIEPFNLK